MRMLAPISLALAIVASAQPGQAQQPPQAEQAPQVVPDAERRPGETLTDRLDRTDGVIKPPPVDAPMQVEPKNDKSRMPVLKPGETPPQQGGANDAGK